MMSLNFFNKSYVQLVTLSKTHKNELLKELKQQNPNSKFYISRNTLVKQQYHLGMNYTQVRENKDAKYSKVKTENYENFRDLGKDMPNMEYLQNSLNKITRQSIIIDCDDNDFGKKTLSLAQKFNLKPEYLKVKNSNGHSQLSFNINTYYVLDVDNNLEFVESTVKSPLNKEEITSKRMYLTVTNLLNLALNGDVNFTGSNCQNPYCTKFGTTTWFEDSKVYTVPELYSIVMNMFNFSNQEQAQEYITNRRKFLANSKLHRKPSPYVSEEPTENDNDVIFLSQYLHPIEAQILDGTLSEKQFNKLKNSYLQNKEYASEKYIYINERIFKECSDFFAFEYRHDRFPTLENLIKRMSYLYNMYPHNYIGYDSNTFFKRVRWDFFCLLKCFDIKKARYTDNQRHLAANVKSLKMFSKWLAVQRFKNRILTKKVSIQKVSEYLNLSTKTISKLLKMKSSEFDIKFLGECLKNNNSPALNKYRHLYNTAVRKIAKDQGVNINDTEDPKIHYGPVYATFNSIYNKNIPLLDENYWVLDKKHKGNWIKHHSEFEQLQSLSDFL